MHRLLALSLAALCLHAQTPAKLEFVAVLSRHGVRSPLWTEAQLNAYSTDPWPKWEVPVGYLTEHGHALMKLMGAFDREYLVKAGLLAPNGCADAARFYFWSDIAQRDIETGKEIAAGMLPGCTVKINAVPEGKTDPLFAAQAAGVGTADPALAAAAIMGRIGGHPQALAETYHLSLDVLQQVLLGCAPGAKCPPEGKTVQKILAEQPSTITPQAAGRLASLNGPIFSAGTISESLLLEYADGKPAQEVGWGRVNKSNLRDILFLQDLGVDLGLRTPYLARAAASNLMSHMLKSMQQAVLGKAVPGAFGKPTDKGLFVIGHDSDISRFGGMLGVDWLLEGYQPNSRPPGGALVFEIWRDAAGKRTVQLYIVAQTLDQLRNATPLTLEAPPGRANIFIPGCSTSAEGWPCDWAAFERAVQASIDPHFVSPTLPTAR